MLVSYHPKKRKEKELLPLLRKHWPTLNRLGLVTGQKPLIWRATEHRTNRSYYVELFQWKDGSSSAVAHQSPEVMAVWERMGPVLEDLVLAEVEPLGLGSKA
jgi:hypothetical protein